jgi:hypothetical protein
MRCSAALLRVVSSIPFWPLALIAGCDAPPSTELSTEIGAAASGPSCRLTARDNLIAACSEDSVPLRMSPRTAPEPVAIEASVSYGLHLGDEAGRNSGAITFVAETSGAHVLYLGTPNVPLAITGPDGPVAATCSSRLTGASCRLMRRGIGIDLAAGAEYRIELGPIAPQRWVRLRLEPRPQPPLVVAAALQGPSTDLFAVDPVSGTASYLLGGVGNESLPRWSPDGNRVAYVVDGHLRVATSTGAGDHLVAAQVGRGPTSPTSSSVTAPAWSPDGTRLVYPFPRPPFIIDNGDEIIDQSYETTLHFVNADGTGDTPYAEPFDHVFPPGMGTLSQPAWSSQDLLAFTNADDCPDCAGGIESSTSRPDGSGYRRLVIDEPYPELTMIDFAPAGDEIVFELGGPSRQLARGRLVPASDPTAIDLEVEPLGIVGRNPVWSPDGRSIAYIGSDGVYLVDADGSTAPRRVVTSTDVRGIDW